MEIVATAPNCPALYIQAASIWTVFQSSRIADPVQVLKRGPFSIISIAFSAAPRAVLPSRRHSIAIRAALTVPSL